jgi:DNA-binding LacI/PurR family transcriptional regulator
MTTVDQNGYKMGSKAAEILIKKINNKSSESSNETHIIEGKLIIRDSSRKR